MGVTLVYLGYLWVVVIHAIFAGVTLYSFWGKKLIGQHRAIPIAILTLFLLFLEVYWMPIVGKMGIVIHVHDPSILEHFGIQSNTNIAEVLRPGFSQIFIWIGSGISADYIGRKTYQNNANILS